MDGNVAWWVDEWTDRQGTLIRKSQHKLLKHSVHSSCYDVRVHTVLMCLNCNYMQYSGVCNFYSEMYEKKARGNGNVFLKS